MAVEVGVDSGFCATAPTGDPAGTNSNIDANRWATKDTSPATHTVITEIGVYITDVSEEADIDIGVYADAGAGEPDERLHVTTIAKGTTGGWKVATGLSWAISAETAYWLAAQVDDTATITRTYRTDAVGSGHAFTAAGQTELPADWGTSGATDADSAVAIYVLSEAGGGATIGSPLIGGRLIGGMLTRSRLVA